MNKKLFFDVDGTICNSPKRIVEIYNKEFNQNSNWEECNKWDFSDVCPLLQDSEQFFARPDFYTDIELTDEYIKGVISMFYLIGYDINFVTIGTKNNLKYKKNWLVEQFPYISNNKMILLEKTDMGKGEIDMIGGILIDDNYINLLTSNADRKICMHKKNRVELRSREEWF